MQSPSYNIDYALAQQTTLLLDKSIPHKHKGALNDPHATPTLSCVCILMYERV